jgi:hypothetical protein
MKSEGTPVDGWDPVIWFQSKKENVAFSIWIRRNPISNNGCLYPVDEGFSKIFGQ